MGGYGFRSVRAKKKRWRGFLAHSPFAKSLRRRVVCFDQWRRLKSTTWLRRVSARRVVRRGARVCVCVCVCVWPMTYWLIDACRRSPASTDARRGAVNTKLFITINVLQRQLSPSAAGAAHRHHYAPRHRLHLKRRGCMALGCLTSRTCVAPHRPQKAADCSQAAKRRRCRICRQAPPPVGTAAEIFVLYGDGDESMSSQLTAGGRAGGRRVLGGAVSP